MIYLKQVKLLDPDLVAGNPEELKYPYKAPAVRFTESFIFRKPVTFLVGENGAGKSTLLEAMMSKYEERDEEEPGMLYDGTEAYKIYANVLPEHIKLIETRKPEKHFFFRAESFFNHAAELDRQAQLELRKYSKIYAYKAYGGRSLLEQSHGESFLSAFLNYASRNTLFILDEPEAALSPQRQLALLVRIHELVNNGCQLIISTHSPILMATNEADQIIREEDWNALRKELDKTYNNFTNRLYQLYSGMSLIELRICYLIKISVKVTDMAKILGRSKPSVSSSRKRLYKKIKGEDGTPNELDELIAGL